MMLQRSSQAALERVFERVSQHCPEEKTAQSHFSDACRDPRRSRNISFRARMAVGAADPDQCHHVYLGGD